MMVDAHEEWLTVEQVAQSLQVGPETVRRWIRARELPAVDLGGRKSGYRVRRAALDRFLAERYSRRVRPGWMLIDICAGCAKENPEPAAQIWWNMGGTHFYTICQTCQSDPEKRQRIIQDIMRDIMPDGKRRKWGLARGVDAEPVDLTEEVLEKALVAGGDYALC